MFRLIFLILVLVFPSATLAESRVCSFASSTAAKATGGVAATSAVTGGAAQAAGMAVVAHSSGAAIATSAGSYVAGTLGTIGTAALGIVTAPAFMIGAATTAVAVGGTLAYCHFYEPPKRSKKVRKAASHKPKP